MDLDLDDSNRGYFEYAVERWHRITGAHRDTIRLLFLKAAINAEVNPRIVACIALNLEDIFEKQQATSESN